MKLKDFTFLFTLISLALFDALFGGALAAILQHEGWKQRINDLWQIGFGTICLSSMALMILAPKAQAIIETYPATDENWRKVFYNAFISRQNARWQAIYLLAMLLAYSEDLLFYPVLWVLNDIGVTNLISGGFDYNFPAYLWPWSLSGWFGFVTRLFFGETIKLPTVWSMILTVGTLAAIIWHAQYRKEYEK